MNKTKGNVLGIITILMWSSLALFSILTTKIPAFQLTSLSFFVATFIGYFVLKKQNIRIKMLFKIPIQAWIVGVVGLFGYHFFYFLAIKNAPVIEANLINYLWPLFIVLFSTLLPSEKLKWYHILGVMIGLMGAFLLISNNGTLEFNEDYINGYIFAFIAAILWSSYSVLSRTLSNIPTYAVTGFCFVTAVFSGVCHFLFEATVIPNYEELFGIFMLGLGPVGGAFYLWDFSVKNADIKLLGSLAYFTPLLSTLILLFLGYGIFTKILALSCFLIVLGSLISSLEYFTYIKKFFVRKKL